MGSVDVWLRLARGAGPSWRVLVRKYTLVTCYTVLSLNENAMGCTGF